MNQIKELIALIEEEKIDLVRMPLNGDIKGLYGDNMIAISTEVSSEKEYACILAEELGHYYTSSGNILDQSNVKNRKQELRARVWAHQYVIKVEDLLLAYKFGCRHLHEIAEFLNITEDFLIDASQTFSRKYGDCKITSNCIIHFNPLGILDIS